MICLAAEDVNTRNNQSFAFRSSSYFSYSAGSRAVSLPERYMADNPAIFATVDNCYFCGNRETPHVQRSIAYCTCMYCYPEPLCSVGWGGGISLGHKCKIQLNAPPLLFRRTTMQKGGAYNRASTVHVVLEGSAVNAFLYSSWDWGGVNTPSFSTVSPTQKEWNEAVRNHQWLL